MADEPPPPAYDAVVFGTWQEDNNVPQNPTPYPPFSAPFTNDSGFENNSLRSSRQQMSSPNVNARLTTEAPPLYNAIVGGIETKVAVSTPATTTKPDDENSSTLPPAPVSIASPSQVTITTPSDHRQPNTVCNPDITNACFSSLFFCVAAVIPITMIVLGVLNRANCADDATIPLYSTVAGSLAVCAFFFFCMMVCLIEDSFGYNVCLAFAMVTIVGHFGVQCWGSYIVFSKWQDWKVDDFICDKLTYLFSFSTLIVYWILWLCCAKVFKD